MAVQVITGTYVLVNAVDLNDHIDSATLEIDVDAVDRTNMGSAGVREFIGGLKSGKLTINFHEDFAAAKVDATLFPLLGTVVTFEIRNSSSARSATNPGYTGSVLVTQHSPIAGKVGDLLQDSVSFPTTGAVARQTS